MKRLYRKLSFAAALGLALATVIVASGSHQAFAAPVIPDGALMVGIGNGLIQQWDTSTVPPTFVRVLTATDLSVPAGSMFDLSGNFLVTLFNAGFVDEFDPTGS